MNGIDWPTLGIVGSIIVGSISATTAILRGFRNLEGAFYKALALHKDEDQEKFEHVSLRLQRLEIKAGLDGR